MDEQHPPQVEVCLSFVGLPMPCSLPVLSKGCLRRYDEWKSKPDVRATNACGSGDVILSEGAAMDLARDRRRGELTVRLSVSEHLRRFVWMMWLGLISRCVRR